MDLARIRGAPAVLAALRRAADATGGDFGFLLTQARAESGLDPAARARTSSARGLFQFVEGTWLATLKRHGAEHGLGWAAAAIERAGGRLTVKDPSTRAAILALRDDPETSARMAAGHAADNRARLERRLGHPVGAAELALAHLLGPGGAARFLRALGADPAAPAAGAVTPGAARANHGLFHHAGTARSLADVFDRIAAPFRAAAASGPAVPPAGQRSTREQLAARLPAPEGLPRTADAAQAAYLLLARLG